MWKREFQIKEVKIINQSKLINNKAEEWKNLSTEANSFIDAMLKVDQSKRLSIADAIKHPWIQKYCIKRRLSDTKLLEIYKNIVSFKVDPKYFFQQATLAFMVHHLLSREDQDDVRKLFFYIDKNGDGRMAYSEIIEGFKKLINVNEKELLRCFKFIDQAKTGDIEYEGKILIIIYIIRIC